MLMVLVTTLFTPPTLSAVVRRSGAAAPTVDLEELPGSGGIDDLVSGTSLSDEEAAALRERGES